MPETSPSEPIVPASQTTQAVPVANLSNDDKMLKYIVPVNRSGWSIVAGYVALFALLLIPAPLALLLGVIALRDLKKHPEHFGRGRAWFAVIFGGLMTILLLVVVVNASLHS